MQASSAPVKWQDVQAWAGNVEPISKTSTTITFYFTVTDASQGTFGQVGATGTWDQGKGPTLNLNVTSQAI